MKKRQDLPEPSVAPSDIPIDADEEVEREELIKLLKKIQGVGDAAAKKICDAQIFSLEQFASMPLGELVEKTGLDKKIALKFQENAKPLCNLGQILDGNAMLNEEEHCVRLTTGSSSVDKLIGGGYPTKLTTCVYAENGKGKTQTMFTAAVMATRPREEGGLDSHIMYIDTEGTFSSKRIREIALARGFDAEEILSKIHIVRVNTAPQQVLIMDAVNKLAVSVPIRLVIVDSVISRFRAEMCGRGVLADRQQMLGKHMSDLHSFSVRNDAVILVTTQVASIPDLTYGDAFQGVGGNVLFHNCAHILKIKKGQGSKRIVHLMKSPYLPEGQEVAQISDKGLCDV